MAYHSQTLGRSLSVSSLEGIQIRLGERFRQPEKVSLPLGYTDVDPSATLSATRYSFGTETTFLRWFDSKKASDAARETIKQQAKEAKEQTVTPQPPVQDPNTILQPTNAKAGPSEPKNHTIPVLASLGGDIMTPITLAPASCNSNHAPSAADKHKRTFDLADFENNASDPFESTELETLNDMEELKTVLAFTSVPAQTGTVETEQPLRSPDLSLENNSNSTVAATSLNINIEAFSQQVVDKPENPEPSKPQTISNGPNSPQLNGSTVFPSTSHLPAISQASSDLFARNCLPPINSSQTDSVLASREVDTPPQLIARGPPKDPFAWSPPSRPPPSRSPPPSYQAVVNNSISSPAITPVDVPPMYPQSLSRYTPLPPAAHQSMFNSADHTQSTLYDPVFDNMTSEDRTFTLTIASMGFPQSRTARAVKQLGHDDRLVVEWLCAVDHLCSQGYQEDKVELALTLQNNDTQKAEEFLLLCKRFEELGFKSEDVRRELILHGNNGEMVLNVLTTNS